MEIPYCNFYKLHERYRDEIDQAIKIVLDHGQFIQGQELTAFEQQFAQFCGTQYAVGVGNGLDALILSLMTLHFEPGDEIIVPANTYIATILAITHNRCVPVLVEPDEHTSLIDPTKIEEKITPKTKAILVVHFYGRAVEMAPIVRLAEKYHLHIVEDGAQAHGAQYQGNRVGHLGTIAGFSFHPTKNLGCCGDGGIVTTDREDLANEIRALRNYGSIEKYVHICKGFHSKLDTLQAAVLSVKLRRLDADNAIRRKIAKFYCEHIHHPLITLPVHPKDELEHVWHIFSIFTEKRAELQAYLQSKGIQTVMHYPIPPHKAPAYPEWNQLSFPITEKLAAEELSLPLHPVLTQDEVEYIVESINQWKV